MASTRRIVAGLIAVAAAACSPAPSPSPAPSASETGPAPSASPFEGVACPDEVTSVMVVEPACGYLSVPEHRGGPVSPTIRIFVVRIDPQSGIEAPDPMVAVGETLGARLEYGGLATLAQRTGRTVYLVDQRGTGLSGASLACPEVDAATLTTLSLPSTDARGTEAILAAVRACRQRLTAEGIDLSAYGLRESALDVEDLRIALGHDAWNVIGFGSASRLALEVARVAPGGVRTAVLDSPVLPQGPSPLFNAEATRSAIAELGEACAADAACDAALPDVAGGLAAAIQSLDRGAVTIDVPASGDGWSGAVHIDGLRFARAARGVMAADGGARIDELLGSIAAILAGEDRLSDPVVRAIVESDGVCLGYVPDCRRVVGGSLLTAACGADVPFVDRADVLAGGLPASALSRIFEMSPFFAACEAWDVEAEAGINDSVRPTVPVLAMTGRYDPFTGSRASLEGAAGLEAALLLEVPAHSYNVFGFNECPRQIRRQWLDAPDQVPDTSCFDEIRTVDLSP